ncbi:MAG: hypothetical protein ACRD0H_13805 [Actinomycetes bacterium]
MRTALPIHHPVHLVNGPLAPVLAVAEIVSIAPLPLVPTTDPARERVSRRKRLRAMRVRWDIVARVLAVLLALGLAVLVVWAVTILVMAGVALVVTVLAAIGAAIAWVHAHLAVLAFTGVVLFLCLGGGVATCAGVHCGGCRR